MTASSVMVMNHFCDDTSIVRTSAVNGSGRPLGVHQTLSGSGRGKPTANRPISGRYSDRVNRETVRFPYSFPLQDFAHSPRRAIHGSVVSRVINITWGDLHGKE